MSDDITENEKLMRFLVGDTAIFIAANFVTETIHCTAGILLPNGLRFAAHNKPGGRW
jgi:hypothetical protein